MLLSNDGSSARISLIYPPVPNNRYYGQDFVIADLSSDTIYKLSHKKELTPFIVRTPSVHASEPAKAWTSELNTDKFILLCISNLAVEAYSNQKWIHEFESGKTSEISFVNEDIPSGKWWPADNVAMPKNMTASLMDVTRLKDAYKENKLRGKLEQLVATLKEFLSTKPIPPLPKPPTRSAVSLSGWTGQNGQQGHLDKNVKWHLQLTED